MRSTWVRLILLFTFSSVFLFCSQKEDPPALFLPDDLEATLWAESPMLYNPTNMDVDSRGRIWITEAVNYRNFNNDSTHFLHHAKGDRVIILEDSNGDGKADNSKVFVQDKDLVSPLGIAVLGNRIFVSCSPNLIVFTDSDGDDKPDSKEIFLTGFGGMDHDHSLHSLVAGPDGNYYFNTGNAGPHVVKDKAGWTLRSGSMYTGGTPYNKENKGNMKSDDGRVWVGGLAMRIAPDGTGLKVMGHNFRNSYEVVVDAYGNLWQNDNDDQVIACRTTWLMEGGNAGYFSEDGTRYWQADQRPWQDIFSAHWHQDDPGVIPAGDNTGAGSPTGMAINEGDALGEKYRGMVLSAEAGRNVIFAYQPKIKGSGYDLGARKNLISSLRVDNAGYLWNDSAQNATSDKWFRPSDVTIGTDGAIYLADWYDPVVGGHQMKDTLGFGRIYRIAPKDKALKNPKLDFSSVPGQIEALRNPAINVRNQAFELLKRGGGEAVTPVKALLMDSNPFTRARAVWLLAQLGEQGKTEVVRLLEDRDEQMRATAFRALRQVEKNIMPIAGRLSTDASPFVRREVAIALRDLPMAEKKFVLLKLIEKYDGADRWHLEAIGQAVGDDAETIYPEVKKIFHGDNQSPEDWSAQLAGLTWRLHPRTAVKDLKIRAESPSLSETQRSQAMTGLAFISTKEAVEAMLALAKSKEPEIAEQATYWVAFRQGNNWFALTDWSKTGIDTERERKVAEMLAKKKMIEDPRQSIYEKRWIGKSMARDPIGGQMLVALAAENKLDEDLLTSLAEAVRQNPDMSVRIQASAYFKRSDTSKPLSITAIAGLEGNALKGSKVFENKCLTCHRHKEKGADIGPDLTLIGKKFDKPAMLDAIINPSAAIVFGYEPWLVNTRSGESLFGFLVADGREALVLKDLAGKRRTVATANITSKAKQASSLMPDPATLEISSQELADVVAFLLK